MDWILLLNQIFEVCIIPLLGVLTTFLIQFIQTKKQEISVKIDDDLTKKYVSMLTDTITMCVQATNQTYVESLKNQNAFTPEAQKHAFELSFNAVTTLLSEESKVYLTALYGDLNTYITKQIEAQVNKEKK